MTHRLIRIIIHALAVVVLFGFTTHSSMGDNHLSRKNKKERVVRKPTNYFSISSSFSGKLDGFIKIGEKKIFITNKTILHRVESGFVEKGTHISNAHLFVAGYVKNRIPTATLILIRPNDLLGTQLQLSIMDSQSKYRIPSDNNPNVGQLAVGAPE